MSNPPNGFNTNTTFNKYKGSYFNNDVDVSGGNIISRTGNLYLAPNSNIYTSNNQIQFDDSATNSINFTNIKVAGSQKLTYNSIEYDIGETALNTTNMSYNPTGTLTTFSSNVTFSVAPTMSGVNINAGTISPAKVQGTAVNLTTANQVISSVKQFTANIRLDAGLVVNNNTLTITNAQLQQIPDITTLKTITTGITYTSGTSTTNIPKIIFTGLLNNISPVTFSYLANVTGDIAYSISNLQSQITTQNTNTTDITYTSGTTTTNIANNTSLANVALTGNINTFTKAEFDNAINFSKSASSDLQTQISTVNTKITDLTYTSGTTTTNIANNTSLANVAFTGNINTFTKTQFDNAINRTNSLTVNCQNTLTSLQTQITNINAVSLSADNTFTGTLNRFQSNIRLDSSLIVGSGGSTTISNSQLALIPIIGTTAGKVIKISYTAGANPTTTISDNTVLANVTFSTLNNITSTVFGYLSGLTENIKTSLDNLSSRASTLETKNTGISYSGTTTTIANTLATSTLTFSTLNNISTTTFGYLSGLTENIKTSLDNLSARILTFEIVGTIIMSPLNDLQTTTSNKYLMCNGQAVSRTTYSALFAKFGTLFGEGDGSTTFNLVNYNGMFLRGMGNQIINGVNYGNYNSTYSSDQDSIQNHTHSGQSGSFLGTVNINVAPSYNSGTGASPNAYTFSNTGQMATGRINDFETKPVSIGIYYYVRT